MEAPSPPVTLIAVGEDGSRSTLRVTAQPEGRHARCTVDVVSGGFSAHVSQPLRPDEVVAFAAQLAKDELPRTARLGGGRAMLLELELCGSQAWSPTITDAVGYLTPSDDDPDPALRWSLGIPDAALHQAKVAARRIVSW